MVLSSQESAIFNVYVVKYRKKGMEPMMKKDTLKLKTEFNSLIDKNPASRDQELSNDLKRFNSSFEGQDFFIVNIFEGAMRLFSKSLKSKMKSYVADLIEDYNNSEVNQEKIEEFLVFLVNKYSDNDKTLLDRILNILGIS